MMDEKVTPIRPEFANFASSMQKSISESPLKKSGGDGTSGGMEARVARLESDMEHVKKSVAEIATDVKGGRATLGEIKVELGRFDERLKHMPTKGFIFVTAAGMVGAISAIVGLIVRMLQ
jgi:hypothetical protein